MVQALERLGAPAECIRFYSEHVEADAVHEQVVRTDVVGDLVAREPHLNRDVVFGIRARSVVEDRLAAHYVPAGKAGGPRYAGRSESCDSEAAARLCRRWLVSHSG